MRMLLKTTFVIVPSSRFWMPSARLPPRMMLLSMSTFAIRSTFSEPNLTAQERDSITQFWMTMSSQAPYADSSRRFFRQMLSSPDSMKQLAIRTLREWSMSMPSPLRILRLFAIVMPSMTTS